MKKENQFRDEMIIDAINRDIINRVSVNFVSKEEIIWVLIRNSEITINSIVDINIMGNKFKEETERKLRCLSLLEISENFLQKFKEKFELSDDFVLLNTNKEIFIFNKKNIENKVEYLNNYFLSIKCKKGGDLVFNLKDNSPLEISKYFSNIQMDEIASLILIDEGGGRRTKDDFPF